MAAGPMQIVLVVISINGLLLNIIEQILLFRGGKLGLSFTTLVLCLSYSDSFICLSTIGRVVGLTIIGATNYNIIFHSLTFGLILLGYLCNSTIIWLMTMERFLAVCMPFKHRSLVTKPTTLKLVAVFWSSSLVITMVACFAQYNKGLSYFLIPRILPPLFTVTFIILLALYGFIFMRVRKQNRKHTRKMRHSDTSIDHKASIDHKTLRTKQERSVLVLSFRIVISFLLCNALFMVNNYRNPDLRDLNSDTIAGIGVCLIVAVSIVDPVLYFFNKKNFRRKRNQSKSWMESKSNQEQKQDEDTTTKERDDLQVDDNV